MPVKDKTEPAAKRSQIGYAVTAEEKALLDKATARYNEQHPHPHPLAVSGWCKLVALAAAKEAA